MYYLLITKFVNWSVLHVHVRGDRKSYMQVLIWIGLLSMRQNMIHDYHGGRERSIGIMVCTKVKGHTQNLFSWSPLPCESLAQESTPNHTSLIPRQQKTSAVKCPQNSRAPGEGEGGRAEPSAG